jgi:hypothetical protein
MIADCLFWIFEGEEEEKPPAGEGEMGAPGGHALPVGW